MLANGGWDLTLILLMWTIWRTPTNASKWRMGFNSAFKGLMSKRTHKNENFQSSTVLTIVCNTTSLFLNSMHRLVFKTRRISIVGLRILKSFRLLTFHPPQLQCLLTDKFLFHYHDLRCPVYCYGRFY